MRKITCVSLILLLLFVVACDEGQIDDIPLPEPEINTVATENN